MGRVTPPARYLFLQQLEDLKKQFRSVLSESKHREAFDLLAREAWSPEQAAVVEPSIPSLIDALNLVAGVHTMGCIEEIRLELKSLREEIKKSAEA